MKKLVEAVGLPLFEQIGKEIRPTDGGQDLYAACRDLFRTFENLETQIADRKGIRRGKLRLGVVTTAKYIAPELLAAFGEKFPGIEFSMKVSNRDEIIQRIKNTEDDLYVMGLPPEDMETEREPFLENPLVIFAPAAHPMAGREAIPFADVVQESFLVRERGSGTRMTMEQVFAERGMPLRIKMELGSNEAIKQAVVGGLGLALLSLSTLQPDASRKELAVLDVEGFPIRRNWYVVRPKGKQMSVAAATFLDFLRNHVQLLSPSPAIGRR